MDRKQTSAEQTKWELNQNLKVKQNIFHYGGTDKLITNSLNEDSNNTNQQLDFGIDSTLGTDSLNELQLE